MPLYNNVIRNLDKEDPKDEDKLGYEFWEGVENLPVIKQIGQYNKWSAENQQALEERARSGELGGFSKALQIGSDVGGAVVGAPFQLIDQGLEAVSDAANIDRRSIDAGITTALTLANVKGSKSTSFKRGHKLRKKLERDKTKRTNVGQPARLQTIDVQTQEILNMHPTQYRRVLAIYRNHEGGISWKQAMDMARLPQGTGPNNPTVYIPPNERIGTQKGDPLQSTINPDDAYQNLRSIKRAWNSQLTQGGRSRRFNLKAFLNNNREDYKRLVSGDWSTTWDTGLAVGRSRENLSRQTAYDNRRTELLNIFREDYGEALERLEIPERRINLDHKLTLVQSVGMYHNVERNSPLHISIQNIALNRGYTPGDAEANLDLADPESHRVKTNFFNDLHGLSTHNNMKYWNGQHRDLVDENGKPISRFKIMDESHKSPEGEALHLEVVEDYFDVVDRGTVILNDAKQVWKAENLTGIMPEGITDELMKVIVDPDFSNYTSETLKPVIESIIYEEVANIKTLQRVLEIEGELEKLDMLTSAETILPEDSAHVKELKKELKKLKTPFKSKWFKKEYEKSLKDQQKGLDIFGYDRLLNDIFRIDE